MLPVLACNFSVDLGGEETESTEPGAIGTALPDQPSTESPTVVSLPTPTSAAPVTVSVAPDGSADFPTLAAAVDAVPAGSTIVLDAGTYRLAQALEIDKSLRLSGAGVDQTLVVGEGAGCVVLFKGPGSFAVEDVTFRYEATGWGSVVVVDDGDLEFKRCRFTGGVRSGEEQGGGTGLWLSGATTGRVEDCVMEGNQLHGIEVSDQSEPTLEGNICSGNEQNGIVYFEEAGGLASENECTGNGLHGIAVHAQAQPTLEQNVCSENEEAGIAFFEDAGGSARQNECTGNGVTGIRVGERAQPTLQGNICSENEKGGIVYFVDAGGLARQNECAGNGLTGILVQGQAAPTLEENVCSENGESGIAYLEDAGGLARRNESTGNGLNGIGVQGQAAPTLEENVCTENVQCGIAYLENGGGVARRNECSANRWGLYLDVEANPELVDNYVHDNQQDVRDDRS
jgi:parallel beta-helix repeat protein